MSFLSQKRTDAPQASDNRLHISIPSMPRALDPRKVSDPVSASLLFMLFEGLVRLNDDCSTTPAQAERIEVSNGGKLYTFHLRECQWSDGSSVTAYDFEKSWKDILDPAFPAAYPQLLYPIKNGAAAKQGLLFPQEVGIEAKDASKLVIELESANPYFLQIAAFCMLFPVNHKIEQKFSDWAYRDDELFVCNGPFKLAAWKNQEEIILKKNSKYWAANTIKFDTVHFNLNDGRVFEPIFKNSLAELMHCRGLHLYRLLKMTGQSSSIKSRLSPLTSYGVAFR